MRTQSSFLGVLLRIPVHLLTAPVAFGLAPLVQLGPPGGSPPCRAEVVQVVLAEPGFGDVGFGYAVVLDGEELLVGASGNEGDRPGAIQVFRDTPTGYAFSERILPSNSTIGDLFGLMLLVEGDRLFAVGGTGLSGPIVFVFARQTSGPSAWAEVAQIPLPVLSYPNHRYFSMDADGDVLVLTTPSALQVRRRDQGGPDAWGITKLIPLPAVTPSYGTFTAFGPNVAVDGTTIAAVVPEDSIHPYWFYALVFERDLGGPNAWGFANWFRSEPTYGFGYWMQLKGDLMFLEDLAHGAYVFARDPSSSLFGEVQALPHCDPEYNECYTPSALRARDGLVARAGRGSGNVNALRIHRLTTGSTGVPALALMNETLFPGVQHWFYSIDVQGERVVLGAPDEGSYAGEVLVVDLACPRAQVPAALTPR